MRIRIWPSQSFKESVIEQKKQLLTIRASNMSTRDRQRGLRSLQRRDLHNKSFEHELQGQIRRQRAREKREAPF